MGSKHLVALATTGLFLWSFDGRALSPASPPYSYVLPTGDGRFVFVMLGWDGFRDAEADRVAEIVAINATYEQSGLYLANDPGTPLWTVDWYSYPGTVQPLSDGVHLIRSNGWTSSPDSEAVTFFANGELLRSYSAGDLLPIPSISIPLRLHIEKRRYPKNRWVGSFSWRYDETLNASSNTYSVSTIWLGEFTFDVKSGEITESSRPVRQALIVAMTGLALSAFLFIWRRKRTA